MHAVRALRAPLLKIILTVAPSDEVSVDAAVSSGLWAGLVVDTRAGTSMSKVLERKERTPRKVCDWTELGRPGRRFWNTPVIIRLLRNNFH